MRARDRLPGLGRDVDEGDAHIDAELSALVGDAVDRVPPEDRVIDRDHPRPAVRRADHHQRAEDLRTRVIQRNEVCDPDGFANQRNRAVGLRARVRQQIEDPDQHARKMKKLKYILCFEEYELAKGVQQNRKFDYRIEGHEKEIKNAVRKRASYCVRLAMIKIIPKLYNREFWPVFVKATKIGIKEKVFGRVAEELLKGLKINTLNLVKR